MRLTVIIPTRNRSSSLHRTLLSLLNQTLNPNLFEIIVVDNGSTDQTKSVCDNFNRRLPIEYHFEEAPGLHNGRHRGITHSHSDNLVFCDDDIEAFPTWLESIDSAFDNPNVSMIGGKNLPKFESPPPEWIIRQWKPDLSGERMLGALSLVDLGDNMHSVDPLYVVGCNFSIRKPVLLDAGGFHPDGMPENLIRFRGDGETHVSEFLKKSALLACYVPKASVWHHIPVKRLTLKYFSQRAFNQGISDSYSQLRASNRRGQPTNHNRLSAVKSIRSVLGSLKLGWRALLIRIYYFKGYNYHQKLAANDLGLREWINRPHYLGFNGKVPSTANSI